MLVFMGMSTPLPKTLIEAVKFFADPVNCREYLVARRWPNGVTCPACGSKAVYFDSSRNGWECKTRHPKRKFTLKTGTIFEDSPLGLDKWLPTVWMIANCKNGVSSWEIHRAIGVTQKTAWFMLHRIRLAMQDSDDGGGGKIGGEVEVDETFIGGKARFMHKKRKQRAMKATAHGHMGKVAVQGLLERHSRTGHSVVRTAVVKNTRTEQVQGVVRANVEAGATLYTDALPSYRGLGPSYNGEYVHLVIDHAEKYVDGQVHTNGLENYWSLLKRALRGTYVAVEPFHLFRYLDEQAFRFNNRCVTDAERFSDVISQVVGRRLMYEQLIGAGSESTPA
jgi:transposase-like protein